MAKIPYVGVQSPFGNRGPDNPTPMNADTRGVTNGMEAFTGTVMGLGNSAVNMLEEDKRRDEALAGAQAQVSLIDYENRIREEEDAITQEYSQPMVDLSSFDEDVKSRIEAIERPKIAGLPADRQMIFDAAISQKGVNASFKAREFKRGLLGNRAEAQFMAGTDALDVQAADPSRPMSELYGKLDAIGMGVQGFMAPDQFEKMKRGAQERLSLGRVNTLFKTADSPEQLDALATDITGQKYIMDSAKAANYLGQIETKKSQMLNRSDVESGKRESAASAAVNKLQAAAVSPYPLDPAYEAELLDKTVGTESHSAALAAVADKKANGMAQTMPLNQLKAEIDAFTEEAKTIGTTDTAFVKSSVDRKNAIYNARLKVAKTYPMEAIRGETGMEFPPLNFTDSTTLSAQISDRLEAVKAYSKQQGIGGIPMNPFTELEQGAIVELLGKGGDSAKMALIQSVAKASTSPVVFREAMASVKLNSPANYYAGELFMLTPNDKVGQDVVKEYYAGEKIRADGTKPLVSDGVLLGEFATRIGSAVDPDTDDFKSGLERFKRLYAAASQSNDKTIVDSDAAERAFSLATGGLANYGGSIVVKPWGMKQGEFSEQATLQIRRMNVKHKLDIEDPEDVQLDSVPGFPGYYTMIGEDGFPRIDKQNKPILLRISNK
jgi:hypothetical protein